MLRIVLAALTVSIACGAEFPAPMEGDLVVKDFRFTTGESIPELRLHYTTVGAPKKDASGKVTNAILIMHGTGGAAAAFFRRRLAGSFSARGSCWTLRSISSSCRTISGMGDPVSHPTGCT
jgi:homoserine O-acetyltransferase